LVYNFHETDEAASSQEESAHIAAQNIESEATRNVENLYDIDHIYVFINDIFIFIIVPSKYFGIFE
jgi:hypothetical protein